MTVSAFTMGRAAEILGSGRLPENMAGIQLPVDFRTDSRNVRP
jgi:hypothetical protein